MLLVVGRRIAYLDQQTTSPPATRLQSQVKPSPTIPTPLQLEEAAILMTGKGLGRGGEIKHRAPGRRLM